MLRRILHEMQHMNQLNENYHYILELRVQCPCVYKSKVSVLDITAEMR